MDFLHIAVQERYHKKTCLICIGLASEYVKNFI